MSLTKTLTNEMLDELLKDCKSPEDLLGKNGIVTELSKRLIERVLQGELTNHLGYDPGHKPLENNSRNGSSTKTLKTKNGEVNINVPRDRESEFEPKFVKKHQRRFEGFDDKIISMYALGMSTRDIQSHLKEIYGTDVSAELISTVTNEVMNEVKDWQSRPLDAIYPILYLDAIRVKIRDGAHVKNKAIYLALGVDLDGKKDLLGMWIQETEGAKFWMQIITDLSNRGVKDVFIACVDGLTGFPDAIHSIFPETEVQLCIVHMIRNSNKYVPYKDRKKVSEDLKLIYTAPNADAAREALNNFKNKWDDKYPVIGDLWERHWDGIIPFMAYPDFIRKAIYTTNAIESMNNGLRKTFKNKRVLPNDEAALKLVYLTINNISKKWTMPIREWKQALNQFAVVFAGRFPINF